MPSQVRPRTSTPLQHFMLEATDSDSRRGTHDAQKILFNKL